MPSFHSVYDGGHCDRTACNSNSKLHVFDARATAADAAPTSSTATTAAASIWDAVGARWTLEHVR